MIIIDKFNAKSKFDRTDECVQRQNEDGHFMSRHPREWIATVLVVPDWAHVEGEGAEIRTDVLNSYMNWSAWIDISKTAKIGERLLRNCNLKMGDMLP